MVDGQRNRDLHARATRSLAGRNAPGRVAAARERWSRPRPSGHPTCQRGRPAPTRSVHSRRRTCGRRRPHRSRLPCAIDLHIRRAGSLNPGIDHCLPAVRRRTTYSLARGSLRSHDTTTTLGECIDHSPSPGRGQGFEAPRLHHSSAPFTSELAAARGQGFAGRDGYVVEAREPSGTRQIQTRPAAMGARAPLASVNVGTPSGSRWHRTAMSSRSTAVTGTSWRQRRAVTGLR